MKTATARQVAWSSLDQAGLEFCWIEGSSARGTILRFDDDGIPFEVRYRFEWDGDFVVRSASIESAKGTEQRRLVIDHRSTWKIGGEELSLSSSCTDLDLWPTPLTNSFATHRLGLKVGKSAEIDVLWIEAPKLRFEKVPQRYTRLAEHRYLFESLDSGFKAEIDFHPDGLVAHYPGLFRRLDP
jgi:hypothetical protein